MSIDPAVIEKLREILGGDGLFDSPEKKIAYSSDASTIAGELADAIARPKTTEQVSRILKVADSTGTPVYARGAGSGLTGGAVPVRGGIVLDFALMNRILDPASKDFCTIGGNVAENAGGLRGVKYGSTREYVMALKAVLANGEVIHVGSSAPKSVTGYDLVRLFVGSEGTLCVFTEILLRLVPMPESVETVLATFPDAERAAAAVCSIFAAGITPRAAELMEEGAVESVRSYRKSDALPEKGVFCLFEVDGPHSAALDEADRIIAISERNDAMEARRAESDEEREHFWSLRRAISPALFKLGRVKINEDICVPRTRLVELLAKTKEIAGRHSLKIVNFGHVGDGNVHVNIILEREDAALRKKAEAAITEVFKAVIEMGGTLSAEHGIGLAKARFLGVELGEKEMALMARLKKLFDPNNILNPGKFTDALSSD